jgi:hypothetical protein
MSALTIPVRDDAGNDPHLERRRLDALARYRATVAEAAALPMPNYERWAVLQKRANRAYQQWKRLLQLGGWRL